MRVRRTGAKQGCSPMYYVQADQPEEQEAIRAGLLDEVDRRSIGWKPYVLAYGFPDKAAAEQAMDDLYPDVALAVQGVRALGAMEEDGA